MKAVKHLIPATDINMGGIIVKQALPTMKVKQVDPFLLLHHGTFTFRDDAPARHQGIGPHPHRGFTPVTFVIEGEVHHRDSRGHNQIAKAGEVQWMHAGAGIIHSERPSEALVKKNGTQEIIQLWINSPKASKMKPPQYQYNTESEITKWHSKDGSILNKLIAGKYADLQGKIKPESDLLVIWSSAQSEAADSYSLPEGYSTMLYLIKGKISIKGYGPIEGKQLVVFDKDSSGNLTIESKESSQYIILTGAPIKEKIVQQGPFVMNSETEILEAMRDYQMGKMGILIED